MKNEKKKAQTRKKFERTHVTRPDTEAFDFDNTREYPEHEMFRFKPNGFWYQVDGDWERWCKSEQPDWIGAHRYRVDLGASNMHVMLTKHDLIEFTHVYGYDPFAQFADTPGEQRMAAISRDRYIDWKRVKQDYDGVEIPIYLWDSRLDFNLFWYYGWDCASGVVWNVRHVKVERIRRKKVDSSAE